MRWLIVPEDITIVDRKTGKPVMKRDAEGNETPWVSTHEDFYFDSLAVQPVLSEGGGEGIRRARKLEAAFTGCKPGQLIGIEDADYLHVRKKIIDRISWQAGTAQYAVQMAPHIEAWEAAEAQNDEWKRKRDLEAAKAAKAAEAKSDSNGASTAPAPVEEPPAGGTEPRA